MTQRLTKKREREHINERKKERERESISMSTVSVPPVQTSPRDDAKRLHRAIKPSLYNALNVAGCDKVALVNILVHCDARQRARIRVEYKAMYRVDICDDIRKCLTFSGDLKTSVLLWMPDPVERDAMVVKEGLRPETQNLKAATEVICSRTPSEIQSFRKQYNISYGVPLEHDIQMQPPGSHRELLLAYVRTPRDEGLESDIERAEEDSRALSRALEGTDEETFINIFSERSRAQLAAVISAYHDIYGNSLENAVRGRRWGLFGDALCTILSCSESPATYFAEVLREAMRGLGTDKTTLTRVIVTGTEIGMQYIKAEYLMQYNRTLNDAVRSEALSKHYKNFLLSLLG